MRRTSDISNHRKYTTNRSLPILFPFFFLHVSPSVTKQTHDDNSSYNYNNIININDNIKIIREDLEWMFSRDNRKRKSLDSLIEYVEKETKYSYNKKKCGDYFIASLFLLSLSHIYIYIVTIYIYKKKS